MDDAPVAANAYPRIQFKTNVDELVDATFESDAERREFARVARELAR